MAGIKRFIIYMHTKTEQKESTRDLQKSGDQGK